jgi:hypothetical protein
MASPKVSVPKFATLHHHSGRIAAQLAVCLSQSSLTWSQQPHQLQPTLQQTARHSGPLVHVQRSLFRRIHLRAPDERLIKATARPFEAELPNRGPVSPTSQHLADDQPVLIFPFSSKVTENIGKKGCLCCPPSHLAFNTIHFGQPCCPTGRA